MDKHKHFIKSFSQKIEHINELLEFEPAETQTNQEIERLKNKWKNNALVKYEDRLKSLRKVVEEVQVNGEVLERERLVIALRSVVCLMSDQFNSSIIE